MKYKDWLKSDNSHIKYVILDTDKTRTINVLDNVYEGISFINIFQQTNVEYIILISSKDTLTSVFNSYLDSFYDFKVLIPWLKINYTESSLLNVTQKLKACTDFVLLFQRPHVRNIKALLQTIIIENEPIMSLATWEKNLIKGFNELEYPGIYVTKNGQVVESSSLLDTSTVQGKIQLF